VLDVVDDQAMGFFMRAICYAAFSQDWTASISIFVGLFQLQENYTAPRMVLAASGVDHQQLLSFAEPLLADLPKAPRQEVTKSQYVGGDFRCQADSQVTPFIIVSIRRVLQIEIIR